ncbi:YCF48-related protein [Sphingomonas azotifigens]|uniref:YCF48-related protein n=1 Tax=Sphingomonas azotifigens TaxID=330920 RepID=UPI000A05A8ED|nr:YCF48-related protein [Sphingomonas azotifigens]
MQRTLLVSTDGQAIMRSHDGGAKWYRLNIGQDLEYDDCVRCLLVDPRDPKAVWAGSERGLFRSEDCGAHWHRVDCALNDYAVWKLAVSESDPNILYAGTGSPTRSAFFRSRDGGVTWQQTTLLMPERCAGVSRPRMLAIAVDPKDPQDVWVGVEEGGLFRTRDGGDSWTRLDEAWPNHPGNSDIHDIVILPSKEQGPNTVLVLVVTALYRSEDGGATWTRAHAKESWGLRYARVLLKKPGSDDEIAIGIGDGTPGTTAEVLLSTDRGASWTPTTLDAQPNSCLWAFGANPADPALLMAGTKFGHFFLSEDGGRHWAKQAREFSEITGMAWLPATPVDMELPHETH